MHSRNDAPITTTAATAAVWKDAMFLFPPRVLKQYYEFVEPDNTDNGGSE